MSRILICLSLLLLMVPASFAEDQTKPKCNKQVHGRFWPDEANQDPKLAQTLAKTGELELCVIRRWRYRWEPMTVRLRDLLDKRDRKARSNAAKPASSD